MIDTLPFFTIILPTYNSEATLFNALHSLASQTYKNFEVLVIDNQSEDNTVGIVQDFKKELENIQFISEKDKGIYDAMNKGVAKARGDWLYFLGSDDTLYDKNVLEQIYTECQGFDVVYGNVYSTRFNGSYDGEFSCRKLELKNICHQGIFFHKRVFSTIGDFNLKYKAHADWHHNIRWFFSDTIKKKYVDMIIANYADGGFSSLNDDILFSTDKHLVLFQKGIGKFSGTHLLKLLKRYVVSRYRKSKIKSD